MERRMVRGFGIALATLALGATPLPAAEEKPVKTEPLTDKVTRLVYADGTEKWEIAGRGQMQFVPTPPQTTEAAVPQAADVSRGYLTFSPAGRGGVLPEYRPGKSEVTDQIAVFAARGEFEPVTVAIRPLQDLGAVTFSCGDFVGPRGAKISSAAVDHYIVEPTAEQIGLDGPKASQVRWVAKWLRPGNSAHAVAAKNVQVYLDVQVPEEAAPGLYAARLDIKPEKGKPSAVTVQLEVLPIKLVRPMAWGFFQYDWRLPDQRGAEILETLKEMRRAGMTQCVISPGHYQNRPRIHKDGVVDFSGYDQCLKLYEQAGFADPPILAMEGLMAAIAGAMGKAGELKFIDDFNPGVKAADIPADVREFAGRVIRRIYDHALEVKWPHFYIYFADEPAEGPNMEKAKFMYGLAREVAPEMQTAGTVYTHAWWKNLSGLIDLNIAHYVHPCNNADANRRWLELAHQQHTQLYGIDFIGPLDTFWEGRQITLTAEKGGLRGMLCWTQWIHLPIMGPGSPTWMQVPFNPYLFVPNTWKGGPWFMTEPGHQGRVWRSLPWIGLREGIDDSRYVRALRQVIADAEFAGQDPVAQRGRRALERVLDEVAWVPGVRAENSSWTTARADAARHTLADAVIEGSESLRK